MIALKPMSFCPCDGRRASLWYLSAGYRYTTKSLKNWEFVDPFRHAGWPKVAGAVIEAQISL
jgi:hypothetical protein